MKKVYKPKEKNIEKLVIYLNKKKEDGRQQDK